jgi:hypothetical protein
MSLTFAVSAGSRTNVPLLKGEQSTAAAEWPADEAYYIDPPIQLSFGARQELL